MAGIGETLRKTREGKGLTLEEVSKATRIHAKVLSSLEEENFESLPGVLYTKGFLKKYSEFLGLDSSVILGQYHSIAPQVAPQVLNISSSKEKRFTGIRVKTFVRIAAVLAGACLLLFIFSKIFRSVANNKKKIPVKAGVRVKKADANKINKAPVAMPPKAKGPILAKGEGLILKISARKDAWLEIKADGEIVFQYILRKGTEETLKALDSFELAVSEAANVTLYLNGRKLAGLGSGVKRGIVINSKGLNSGL